MNYLNYLENLDFESMITTSFLLPFFAIMVVIKILSAIIFSFLPDDYDDDPYQVTVFSNVLLYFIFSFFILTVYDYNDRKGILDFRYSQNVFEENSKEFVVKEDTKLENDQNINIKDLNSIESKTFSWDDISITPEAERLIDNANLTEKYVGLSSEDIIKLKKIMSDPNPDPLSKAENKIDVGATECKWCGKKIDIKAMIYTSKDLLGIIVKPKSEDPFEMIASVMTVLTVSPQACIESYELSDFNQHKYQFIVTDEKEFCSLKCEKEFKNNRRY